MEPRCPGCEFKFAVLLIVHKSGGTGKGIAGQLTTPTSGFGGAFGLICNTVIVCKADVFMLPLVHVNTENKIPELVI